MILLGIALVCLALGATTTILVLAARGAQLQARRDRARTAQPTHATQTINGRK
jgi:hypothetical protein